MNGKQVGERVAFHPRGETWEADADGGRNSTRAEYVPQTKGSATERENTTRDAQTAEINPTTMQRLWNTKLFQNVTNHHMLRCVVADTRKCSIKVTTSAPSTKRSDCNN